MLIVIQYCKMKILISFLVLTCALLFTAKAVYYEYNEVSDSSDYSTYIFFNLYTRQNPDSVSLTMKRNLELPFNKRIDTIFIIHDYRESHEDADIRLKNAFLNRKNYNVIIVDWKEAQANTYLNTLYRIRDISVHITKMVEFLVAQGAKTKNMQLIGHGVGAHICGTVGHLSEFKIPRITGLDPAGLWFHGESPSQPITKMTRLDKKSAVFVEVIHTDMPGYGYFGYGYNGDMGHLDLYPDEGSFMYGCNLEMYITPVCSHNRAWDLYTEVVIGRRLVKSVTKCNRHDLYYVDRGRCKVELNVQIWYPFSKTLRGAYFFITKINAASFKNEPPFLGEIITENLENAPSMNIHTWENQW